jgi:hypothetical protein
MVEVPVNVFVVETTGVGVTVDFLAITTGVGDDDAIDNPLPPDWCIICLLAVPVADCSTRTTLVAGEDTTEDVETFCPEEFELNIVAVERILVFFVDMMLVALEGIEELDWTGGGLDLNAVIVIPLLGVDPNEEGTRGDFLAAVVEAMGSITKLLPVDTIDVGVCFPFADGITCKDEPTVVTTFMVGGVEIIDALLGGSGMKPLKLAKISATFLRST